MSDPCQTPSNVASRVGNSGVPPKRYHESCFVADEASGKLDIAHRISTSDPLVTVCIETTRYVGPVDAEGFLVRAPQHIGQGTLAKTLLLTVRARISASEFGGRLGVFENGNLLEVEVFLHEGSTAHKRSLGMLEGYFGGRTDWQEFELQVDVGDVKFPADPCPGQRGPELCGREIEPRPNEITFEFTGTLVGAGISMEVDWLTLEPRDAPGLAWRPVLLVHGWTLSSAAMRGSAWAEGLTVRDVAWHAIDVTPTGSITNNGAQITQAVDDLKKRFGVERVHVVGHSKGGLDTREHSRHHNDIETLIMIGTPNAGSFLADIGAGILKAALRPPKISHASLTVPVRSQVLDNLRGMELTTYAMKIYNDSCAPNPNTTYVGVAGDYDSLIAKSFAIVYGGNDEIVSVASVEALPYATAKTYRTSTTDHEHSQDFCGRIPNHCCLRYYERIVDDLFPVYMALTAPLPLMRGAAASEAIHPPGIDTTSAVPGVQGVMSDAGIASSNVTYSHTAILDPVGMAIFLILGDQEALRFELVSPTGSRIDATTPLADPSVTYASFGNAASLPYTGYSIERPEVGRWTLEVTGTSVSPPDGSAYAVTALAPLTLGTGVVLMVRVDQELYAVGGAVMIIATITEDGLPVTDATVRAVVIHPDSTTTTEVVLSNDGTNGEYSGLFTATTEAGLYAIFASAERTVPAFTREQVLLAPVARSSTAFSGTVSDHGADIDGDGLYDQLVFDVELSVDVAAAYRVFGTLTDGAGTVIEQVRTEQELQPGLQTVSLAFDGALLFAHPHTGPYVLEDVVLEELATAIGLGRGPSYTTAAYAHTEFQRPPCLLTGNASDHGLHTDIEGQLPYEELVVAVEVDLLADANVQARASLYSEDGTFVAGTSIFTVLSAGIDVLEFHFGAKDIVRSGKPGPYTVRLLSIWGTTLSSAPNPGAPVSLRAPGIVAITQPYTLEDFSEGPRYTVGGTVTGLVGTELVLKELVSGIELLPGNGAFTFGLTKFGGTPYNVRITRQPTSPGQVCSIVNATGTVATANVTDIAVHCVTPPTQEGLDPDFGLAGKVTASRYDATAMALQSDGKIVLVGGTSTLARYLSDGSADVSFGTDGTAFVFFEGGRQEVKSVAIQPDGKIVVAGYTLSVTTSYDFAFARYTADGDPDTSFGTDGMVTTDIAGLLDLACTVLIQADGNILVAGNAQTISPSPGHHFAVARYHGDGSADMSFGTGGRAITDIAGDTDLAAAALLQHDGKIVVAGRMARGSEDPDWGLARFTVDGTIDPSFGGTGIVRTDFGLGGGAEATDLALQRDGKLVVAGRVGRVTGEPELFALARFDDTGRLDPSFGSAGLATTPFGAQDAYVDAVARAVVVQPDGKIVVAGDAGGDFAVARYTTDGTLDPSFGSGGTITVDFSGTSDSAECVALQADGKIVVGGSTGPASMGMARLLP